MNSINILGRITADLDLKATTSGKFVTSFTIATDDGWGENKRTYFIDVVAWNKNAENICQFFSKGSRIAITGKLTTRQYEHQGNKRKATEVLVDSFTFVDSKKDETQESAPRRGYGFDRNDDPFANESRTIDISDDSLPF